MNKGKRRAADHEISKNNNLYKDSEIIKSFQQYAKELDEKHDRHERIFKISRDINIESKRLIFFLHTFRSGSTDSEKVLSEARSRLIMIVKSHFSLILQELHEKDIYQFLRAFSAGVEEFVEAFSFYNYLQHAQLLTFEDIIQFLSTYVQNPCNTTKGIKCENNEFLEKEEFEESEKVTIISEKEKSSEKHNKEQSNFMIKEKNTKDDSMDDTSEDKINKRNYVITMTDYVLGLNDLTGELMRYCINQVSNGQIETAFAVRRFVSNLYVGMLSVDFNNRNYHRKMYTVEQSVRKVEMACYAVQIRGSEIPRHIIINALEKNDDEEINF